MSLQIKATLATIFTFTVLSSAQSATAYPSGAEAGEPSPRTPFGLMKKVWKAPRVSQNPYGDGSSWTIEANKTEENETEGIYTGLGHVQVYVDGQDAKLSCDKAIFDQNTNELDVSGNVSIEHKGLTTRGSHYKFKISDNNYLVTKAGAEPSKLNLFSHEGKKHK